MTDVIVVIVIIAFFAAMALLVRPLDRLVADSGAENETDPEPGVDDDATSPDPRRFDERPS